MVNGDKLFCLWGQRKIKWLAIYVTPSFKEQTRLAICVPTKSTHTTTEYIVSETMLYIAETYSYLTLTSEYHRKGTNLWAPFFTRDS
jgi:hypothetical protein